MPGLVVLDTIRKQVEQAMGRKLVNSTPPWPLSQLLPPGSCSVWVPVLTFLADKQRYGNVSQINPFLSNLHFGLGVSLQQEKP